MACSNFEMDNNFNLLPPRFFCNNDYTSWKTRFEEFIAFSNPDLWIPITERYERPRSEGKSISDALFKPRKLMDEIERKEFDREKKAFETIQSCLPKDVQGAFTAAETSYDLWAALSTRFGEQDKLNLPEFDDKIKEESIKSEDELKALQSQVLIMETEREEMRSKIQKMEEQILELQSQQSGLIKLQEDHDLALKTIQDLHQQLSQVSHSATQPEKVGQPAKVVKKIYASKSSCEKKVSQFTNYSLQKNKKYSKKSQSTRTFVHTKVDFQDSVKVKHVNKSVSRHQKKTKRASKPIQPSSESSKTKSCAYTRAQMFALAPSRCLHMVLKQPKDFVPFSLRRTPSPSIPRQQFRSETPRFISRWNSMSLDYVDTTYRWLSRLSKPVGTVLRWVPKVAAT